MIKAVLYLTCSLVVATLWEKKKKKVEIVLSEEWMAEF